MWRPICVLSWRSISQGKFHELVAETYWTCLTLLRAGWSFRSLCKMRCNDDLCTFKALARFRIERFGSTRTLTHATFSTVLDDLGRPDFGFSRVVLLSSNFLTHFRIRGMLYASFKWRKPRIFDNLLRAKVAE